MQPEQLKELISEYYDSIEATMSSLTSFLLNLDFYTVEETSDLKALIAKDRSNGEKLIAGIREYRRKYFNSNSSKIGDH